MKREERACVRREGREGGECKESIVLMPGGRGGEGEGDEARTKRTPFMPSRGCRRTRSSCEEETVSGLESTREEEA